MRPLVLLWVLLAAVNATKKHKHTKTIVLSNVRLFQHRDAVRRKRYFDDLEDDEYDDDTNYVANYGACTKESTLTGCIEKGTKKQFLCITRMVDGSCAIEYVRPKDESSDEVYFYKNEHTKDLTLVIQDLTTPITIQSIPNGIGSLKLDNLDHITLENLTLPSGLHSLQLTDSNIQGYPIPGSFSNIQLPASLRYISLQDNHIKHFDPTEWKNSSISILNLNNNRLSTFGHAEFPNKLTKLYAKGNHLTDLSKTTLPPSLTHLVLSNNKLNGLESLPLANLHKLRSLWLNGNRNITTLTKAGANALPSSLKMLSLRSCSIATIESGFVLPAKLTTLDLSHNKLTSLKGLKFPKTLKKLSLDGNPLMDLQVTNSTLVLLKGLNHLSVPKTTSITCSNDTKKTLVQNKFYVCVGDAIEQTTAMSQTKSNGSSSKSSNLITIILCICCASAGIAAFAYYAYIRHSDKSKTKPVIAEEEFHDDHYTQPSRFIAQFQRHQNSLFYNPQANADIEPQTQSQSLEDCAGTAATLVALQKAVDLPNIFERHQEFLPLALPPARLHNITPYIGQLSRAELDTRSVILKPFLSQNSEATLSLLSHVRHPKIVAFLGVSWDWSGDLIIVNECLARGSLREVLSKITLTLEQKLAIAIDIAEALTYLHFLPQPFIHKQLSYDSIMVNATFTAKLNLPLNHTLDAWNSDSTDKMLWIAPEVVCDDTPTPNADVYSFGVLLSCLDHNGMPQLNIAHEVEILRVDRVHSVGHRNSVLERMPEVEWFTGACHPKIKTLGTSCLDLLPDKRPSPLDIVYALRNLVHELQQTRFM